MHSSKSLNTLVAILALSTLTSCNSPTPVSQTPDIQVVETGNQTTAIPETIHINNCGGKGNSEQIVERSFSTSIEGATELQVGYEIVVGSVSVKYGQYKNVSKSLKLIAPPGTNMEFVISWTEQAWVGSVLANGRSGGYSVHVPLSVEQISGQDLGCNISANSATPIPTLQASSEPIVLTVSALDSWQNTGIFIQANDLVEIKYLSGQWSVGGGVFHDANGTPSGYICSQRIPASECVEIVPDAVQGSLVARVSDSKMFIGNYSSFTSSTSGYLEIAINDGPDGLYDNSGEITASVAVVKP